MKRILPIILTVLLLVGCTMSATVLAESTDTAASESKYVEGRDTIILFTSDVHCGIDQGFGYAGLAAVRDSLSEDNNVILVDDGDSVQGEPIGTITKGEAIIELMNTVGYDLAIPGNHEFDYGLDSFFSFVEKANFPYISCNFNKEGELVLPAYTIIDVAGTKIGFVGISTPESISDGTPKTFQDEDGNYIYGFMEGNDGQNMYDAVQSAVDAARAEGADYVIAVAHLGNEAGSSPYNYADVLGNTTGIDAMTDGHTHDTDQLVMKNKDGEDVIRAACGTKLSGIGYIKIAAEDGSLSYGLYTWNNDVSAPELLGIENEVSEAVATATADLDKELDTVVATSTVDLTISDPTATDSNGSPIRIVRSAETNLGDFCADAYRDQTGADIAVVNGGGVRVSIPAGDITLRQIMQVHPFGNQICVIEVTGQQILDALEYASCNVPGENGSFLQVSGMSYEIHTYIESSCTSNDMGEFTGVEGEYRVKNVKVGGEDLDLEKTYTLAGTDHTLLNYGGGMTMFKGSTVLQKDVKLDNQVLIDYITDTLGGVVGAEYENPYGQGRIVAVEEKP